MLIRRNVLIGTLAMVFTVMSVQAYAQQNTPALQKRLISIGGGLSHNEISSPDEDDMGFQLIVSYDLVEVNLIDGVDSSVEVGYMDFGFSEDDTGIWGSYVIDGLISGDLGWLAQAGLDFGDDSGLMLGAGLSVSLDPQSKIRFEYVVRDEVDSLQVNFFYHL